MDNFENKTILITGGAVFWVMLYFTASYVRRCMNIN